MLMRRRALVSVTMIGLCVACVDRLYFDIALPATFPIVVNGFISSEPGPYRVEVNKAFDAESKDSIKLPVSVKRMEIVDDQGKKEVLSEIGKGVYETSRDGLRGVIGRVYKIKLELLDGRIYESIPDTLPAPGRINDLFLNFKAEAVEDATKYGYDVIVNSSGSEDGNARFMWKYKGTFKALTHPEFNNKACFYLNGKCNFAPSCSGMLNIAPPGQPPVFERIAPCTCCVCWYDRFNSIPVLSDIRFLEKGDFPNLKVTYIPIDQWILRDKIHIQVDQFSLTHQAYTFWQAVLSQKNAINSLFQPVSGKIPSHFIQTSGDPSPINGIFYATSISSKSDFIRPIDVPNPNFIPEGLESNDSCLKLFPYATTVKPDFWVD